ncbi:MULTISPECIES: DUF6349 family protein [Asanoa]|nr:MULTISPECIES: DUF6349 family protein [Asanoa]GIF74154.1 hypothetical protein Asi02nite_36720 [Asanoa siamensis]
MTKVLPGQLSLFDDLDAEVAPLPGPQTAAPSLYDSPSRGLVARTAEVEAWRARYGNWSSIRRSHAWEVHITCPDTPTARCQPTVLSADLRCDCLDNCCCVGDLLYRGACRGCDWEGEPRNQENAAVEDACDHAWPGWRDLPVVPRVPEDRKRHGAWVDRVATHYPTKWLTDGGPIRTRRSGLATRHVPGRTPFGGYDLAAEDPADAAASSTPHDGDPPAQRDS